MDRLLAALSLFSVALILWVLFSVRRTHIRVEYSVTWLFAATLLLILAQWRATHLWIGQLLGVVDAPLALLVPAGAIFLVVLYRLSLRISGLKDANIKLAQKVAILEFRLEALSEEVKTNSAG